jgi:hypothetical protein
MFDKLRMWAIDKLAGDDIPVLINMSISPLLKDRCMAIYLPYDKTAVVTRNEIFSEGRDFMICPKRDMTYNSVLDRTLSNKSDDL